LDLDNKYGLKECQETLLSMIKKIDKLFSDSGIFYTFVYGSALGAVREKGFIPWDDDIDIAVLREDVDLVVKTLSQLEYYFETSEEHLRPSAPIMHVSCVDKRDITKDFDIKQYPEIDIWIIDRVPQNPVKRRIARLVGLSHDFFTYRQAPINHGDFVNNVAAFIINHISKNALDILQRKTLDYMLWLGKNENCVTEAYHIKHFRVYDRAFLLDAVRIPFEDMLVPVPRKYDEYLTIVYGDYMTPPPETSTNSTQTKSRRRDRGTAVTYSTRMPDHHS